MVNSFRFFFFFVFFFAARGGGVVVWGTVFRFLIACASTRAKT